MQKWAYKVVSVAGVTDEEVEQELTAFGREGWELVSLTLLGDDIRLLAVFKRPRG